jgi:RNA polymerase sigma-70 factor (ECF subfamily)
MVMLVDGHPGTSFRQTWTAGSMSADPSAQEDLLKVEEFLSGDARAFEFLFEKYREKVYVIAFRFTRNKEDALEVVQEVFIRVYQGLSSFKTGSKFYTWLYRISVNRAIDFARAKKVRRTVELDPSENETGNNVIEKIRNPDSQDPADLAVRKELSDRLLEAIDRLSPKHRAVFILHAMENLSYKEISDVVGCRIGTVMSRLFFARRKLQALLSEYDRTRTP